MELEVTVSLVLSVISLAVWLYTVGFKMGTIETKVSTLWEIYVKDALSETMRSQRRNPKGGKVEELFSENLREAIRKVSHAMKPTHKRDDLLIMIEKKFGDDLMRVATEKKVPYRLILGTAIHLAESFKGE